MSGRPVIAQLLPLLGAHGAHALLHFSAIKPSDVASASCELAAGREARTQLHQLLRSEPSLKPLEATTQVGEGVDRGERADAHRPSSLRSCSLEWGWRAQA